MLYQPRQVEKELRSLHQRLSGAYPAPKGEQGTRLELRRERQKEGDGKHRLEVIDLEKEIGQR